MYKVLLVDDEYMILNGLEKLFDWEAYGLEVAAKARNGQQALLQLESQPIDLVISDVSMPIKNGLDFVKEARASGFSFEVIMLSGYQEFDYVREALRFGSVNYLVKPVDEKEMQTALQAAVQRLQQRSQARKQAGYLAEFLIQKWLHNEADSAELLSFFKVEPQRFAKENYTVIFIRDEAENPLIQSYFQSKEQPFICYSSENKLWILIYMGLELPLKVFSQDLLQTLGLAYDVLVVGETVGCAEDVFLSYDSALTSNTLHEFYSGECCEQKDQELYNDVAARGAVPAISFVKLNQALAVHDFYTLEQEIESIFKRMEQGNMAPVYARHLTFLIFIDLYRNFKVSEIFYETQSRRIMASHHFEELYQCIQESLWEIKDKRGNRQYSPHIQELLHIIHREYHQEITLKEISDRLFLNSMYAGQLFKKEVKKSFSQYLNQYRLKVAQKLLLETNEPIGTIAVKSGYATANYLSKNFKKLCGLSPKEFRKKYTKNYIELE